MKTINDAKKFNQMKTAVTKFSDGLYHNRKDLFGESVSSGEVTWQQTMLRRLKDDGYIEPRSNKPDPRGPQYKIKEADILSPFLDDDTLYAYIWPDDAVPIVRKEPATPAATPTPEPSVAAEDTTPFVIEGSVTPELLEKMLMSITPNIIYMRDKIIELGNKLKTIESKFDKLYTELGGKVE